MKTYKVSIISKYFELISKVIIDYTLFFFVPYVVVFSKNLRGDMIFMGLLLIIIFHFKVNRIYFPFVLELSKDKIRLRYFKNLFLKPFFMAKFFDITIYLKNIENATFLSHEWHGSIHFYLKNGDYHLLTNANGSTLKRFHKDLEQALKEYRENEQLDKSQL